MASPEEKALYFELLVPGTNFAQMVYGNDKSRLAQVNNSLFELFKKMQNVALQKNQCRSVWEGIAQELAKKPSTAMDIPHMRTNIENFLSQGKGALDLFSNQFLEHTVGYKGKWHHKKLVQHLNSQAGLDPVTCREIEDMLNKDWDTWLCDFCLDRDVHHEANFNLSAIRLENGLPKATITRQNGQKINDVLLYIDRNWENLFNFLKDLVRLIYATREPGLKTIMFNS